LHCHLQFSSLQSGFAAGFEFGVAAYPLHPHLHWVLSERKSGADEPATHVFVLHYHLQFSSLQSGFAAGFEFSVAAYPLHPHLHWVLSERKSGADEPATHVFVLHYHLQFSSLQSGFAAGFEFSVAAYPLHPHLH
jgi:uncharacterized membrane protein (UPF0136 family)